MREAEELELRRCRSRRQDEVVGEWLQVPKRCDGRRRSNNNGRPREALSVFLAPPRPGVLLSTAHLLQVDLMARLYFFVNLKFCQLYLNPLLLKDRLDFGSTLFLRH